MNRFSIVVCCYNYERYLAECLDSLIGQEPSRYLYEIICINDGSTDGTRALLDRYASEHSILRVIHTTNSGLEKSRNRGIRESRHEWIVCVDADDALDRAYLKTMDTAISSHPGFDFYYCKDYLERRGPSDPASRQLPDFDPDEIFARGDFFATGTAFLKRSLEAVGYFPEEVKNCGLENYSVILSLLAAGKRGRAVPHASFLYRLHDANMTLVKRQAIIEHGKQLLARHGKHFTTNEFHPYGLRLDGTESL